jgi:hypothetical protein
VKFKLNRGPYTNNKVPHPILWVEQHEGRVPYCRGYRDLSSIPEGCSREWWLVVRALPGKTGQVVWLMLDQSNGNPELPGGKSYVWAFPTKAKALAHRDKHVKNKKWAPLSMPVKYLVVDRLDLP